MVTQDGIAYSSHLLSGMNGVEVFKVFPCGSDKHPLINNWKDEATNDQAKLNEWTQVFRDRLTYWGIPTGKTNGVLAIDIDTKKGKNGFVSLTERNLKCPTTMSQRTVSGGMHLLYAYPNDGKHYGNRAGLIDRSSGIDVRGEGGYICAYGLDSTPIAPPPEWLLKEVSRSDVVPGEVAGASSSVSATILDKAIHTIRQASEGERNHTLNTEAFKVAQLVTSGSIDKDLATTLLRTAGLEIGLTPHEVEATLSSAFRGGILKPIQAPFGEPQPSIDIPAIPEPTKWTPTYLKLTDLTNLTHLRRPQLFKHWSTLDIHLTTADGGTGKSTLKLYEAICLALGERFLGFECVNPGKTLFITGEDTKEKLAAMLGKMMTEMGIMDDAEKVNIILNSIIIKKDSDLCMIQKDRYGFLTTNEVALNQVLEAVKELKPKMIVFDPIASFWGSEAALNDMAKAVSKFVSRLSIEGNCNVEMINHMGKVSSQSKDMSQFAGRGGTGLPSHSRVNRVMRTVDESEYSELTGRLLQEGETCLMIQVSKFTDGSPLLNKPFLVIRKGYLFRREEIPAKLSREEDRKANDAERVYSFIKENSLAKRYPTKAQVEAHFASLVDKLSKTRVTNAINLLTFEGWKGHVVREEPNPDATMRHPILVVD